MLSVKQGAIKYHFWVFGMTQPGIEPQSPGPIYEQIIDKLNYLLHRNNRSNLTLQTHDLYKTELFVGIHEPFTVWKYWIIGIT